MRPAERAQPIVAGHNYAVGLGAALARAAGNNGSDESAAGVGLRGRLVGLEASMIEELPG